MTLDLERAAREFAEATALPPYLFNLVFTMLGQIGTSLNASGSTLGWILIATIVSGTVSAALFPALGSMLGQRRLMVVAMGCLCAGSLVSAIAPDATTLLIGRIVAAPGFAAGSLSVAIVGEHRSGASLPRSFGVIAAFAGAAAAVGFSLGGGVEQAARGDWRSVFAAMAVVSAVTAALAVAAIPGGTPGSRRTDIPGALLLAGGLVAALLPITEGAAWGWDSWRVVGLFAAAVVLLTAWAAAELRHADPLVRLAVLALPEVIGGTALFFVTAATVGVINLTVPPFIEAPATAGYGGAASVFDAGLDMLPFAAAITVAGFVAGLVARRASVQLVAIVTLGCEALALVLLAAFHQSAAQVVILLAVFGAGHGGTLAVEYVILTRPVPPAAAGAAVGVASAVAGISGAVATAVTTALLARNLVRAGSATLPAAAGYEHAWLFAAAVAAVGAIVTAARAGPGLWRARPGPRPRRPPCR
ncbi:MAG TPA: MFS transporter [Trebonia sp.]|nr:MFS transporter [Trebonia sp.]